MLRIRNNYPGSKFFHTGTGSRILNLNKEFKSIFNTDKCY